MREARVIAAGESSEAHAAFKRVTGTERETNETIASRLRRGGTARTGTVILVNGHELRLAD